MTVGNSTTQECVEIVPRNIREMLCALESHGISVSDFLPLKCKGSNPPTPRIGVALTYIKNSVLKNNVLTTKGKVVKKQLQLFFNNHSPQVVFFLVLIYSFSLFFINLWQPFGLP